MRTRRPIRLVHASFPLLVALAGAGCGNAPDIRAAPDSASAAAPSGGSPTAVYDCAGTAVEARFDGGAAALLIDGETVLMTPIPAASGARYEGSRADGVRIEWWTKGEGQRLSIAGHAPSECSHAAYRARGNEPFWSIDAIGDTLRWTTPSAPAPIVFGNARRAGRDDGFDVSATQDGATITLSSTDALCRDSMSGMPHPHTVTVRINGASYRGCGGDPGALLRHREWTVVDIAGAGVEGPRPTLAFMADGGVGGFAGCNRWRADATLTDEGLAFGPAASTRMACPEAAMAVEQAFLAALVKVTRHDVDEADHLLLKAGDDTVIRATPAAADAGPPGD